jgi:hypothetical protein
MIAMEKSQYEAKLTPTKTTHNKPKLIAAFNTSGHITNSRHANSLATHITSFECLMDDDSIGIVSTPAA